MRISAEAVEGFARTMANAGFLERALEERTTLQMERLRAERHTRQRPALFRGELLRMRWSFGDPDAMLTRSLPYVDWMFSRTFVLAVARDVRRLHPAARRAMGRVQGRARVDVLAADDHAHERRRVLGHVRRGDPHPRARPRLRMQAFRRRGARARVHADLLPAGVLLQRLRCVELPRAPGAALGHGRRRMDPVRRRQRRRDGVVGRRAEHARVQRRGGRDVHRRSYHPAHERQSAASARRLFRASPIGWRSRTSACARSPTSTGGCSGNSFGSTSPSPPRRRASAASS